MILEVAINIAIQFIFFIFFVCVIPALNLYIQAIAGKNISKQSRSIVLFVKRWTGMLLATRIADTMLANISGLAKGVWIHKFKPNGYKISELHIMPKNFQEPDTLWKRTKVNVLYDYMRLAFDVLIGPIFSIVALLLLLPETFMSVAATHEMIIPLADVSFSLSYIKNLFYVFYDIILNKLVIGSLYENVVLFAIWAWLLIYVFSDNNSNFLIYEDKNRRLKISGCVKAFPVMTVLLIVFNVVLSIISIDIYETVSFYMNVVGIYVALVLTIKEIARIIKYCGGIIFKFLLKKFGIKVEYV